MPIYTRTGDKGLTGLTAGKRISKSSPLIKFIGNLDELNAILGVCVSEVGEIEDEDFEIEIDVLEGIQKDLFIVGAVAAGTVIKFDIEAEVDNIEETIDDYEKILPKLKNFVLPGGCKAAAQIHYARTLVRKVEREAVELKSPYLGPFLPYLNRLSDLLFVVARYINYKLEVPELIWKRK